MLDDPQLVLQKHKLLAQNVSAGLAFITPGEKLFYFSARVKDRRNGDQITGHKDGIVRYGMTTWSCYSTPSASTGCGASLVTNMLRPVHNSWLFFWVLLRFRKSFYGNVVPCT